MGKKKVTHKKTGVGNPKTESHDDTLIRQFSMEDNQARKMQSLRSLNALLLKEMVEKRKQVESLVEAKEALEAELTRSGSEKSALRAELTRASEENVRKELDESLFLEFVEMQTREMVDVIVREKGERETEIERLRKEIKCPMGELELQKERSDQISQEMGLMMVDLELRIKETCGLKEKVFELEGSEGKLEEEIQNLKIEIQRLVFENKKKDDVIQEIRMENNQIEIHLDVKVNEVNEILREKTRMESEGVDLKTKIDELEKELESVYEIVSCLNRQQKVFCSKVFKWEKKCGEATENSRDKVKNINEMAKTYQEKLEDVDRLKDEKDLVKKELLMCMELRSQVSEMAKRIEETYRELEEVKKDREGLIEKNREINGQIDSLRKAKDERENDLRVQLESERVNQKATIDVLEEELERMNTLYSHLSAENSEMYEELQKFEEERKGVKDEIQEIKCQIESLRNKVKSVEELWKETNRSLSEARKSVSMLCWFIVVALVSLSIADALRWSKMV